MWLVELRYSNYLFSNKELEMLSHARQWRKYHVFLFQKGSSEALGEVQFFPKSIFEMKYYPYYGKLRHVSESFTTVHTFT